MGLDPLWRFAGFFDGRSGFVAAAESRPFRFRRRCGIVEVPDAARRPRPTGMWR
ncbi:hypothetical protein [Streptomyces litmocidini]|uniref:Uncharacterized protein n=1 Tax=Streptomyces litmocidini TaxID=67318 RepID=A0ABW7U6H2_9ACTN